MSEAQRHTVIPRTLIFVFRGDDVLLMKYAAHDASTAGENREKSGREGIYNPIGGHVEADENVIESAVREANEEAGITLTDPKIKGIIHSIGFAEKNVMLFIITAGTSDEALTAGDEGEVQWVPVAHVSRLNTFADLVPLLDKLSVLGPAEMIVGVARYDGFDLKSLDLQVA